MYSVTVSKPKEPINWSLSLPLCKKWKHGVASSLKVFKLTLTLKNSVLNPFSLENLSRKNNIPTKKEWLFENSKKPYNFKQLNTPKWLFKDSILTKKLAGQNGLRYLNFFEEKPKKSFHQQPEHPSKNICTSFGVMASKRSFWELALRRRTNFCAKMLNSTRISRSVCKKPLEQLSHVS